MFRALFPCVALAAFVAIATARPVAQAAPPAAPRSDARPAVLINLNTATIAQLQELPGVGQKTAARIVEYREKNGPFKKIEELMNVQGIGEKSFLKLRTQITVDGKTPQAPSGR